MKVLLKLYTGKRYGTYENSFTPTDAVTLSSYIRVSPEDRLSLPDFVEFFKKIEGVRDAEISLVEVSMNGISYELVFTMTEGAEYATISQAVENAKQETGWKFGAHRSVTELPYSAGDDRIQLELTSSVDNFDYLAGDALSSLVVSNDGSVDISQDVTGVIATEGEHVLVNRPLEEKVALLKQRLASLSSTPTINEEELTSAVESAILQKVNKDYVTKTVATSVATSAAIGILKNVLF